MDTSSDEWRRECEARWYLRLYPRAGPQWDAKLARIEAKRGKAAAEQLRADMRVEYVKGRVK